MSISKKQAKRIQESRKKTSAKKDEYVLEPVKPVSRQEIRYRRTINETINKTRDAVLNLYSTSGNLETIDDNIDALFENMYWWEDMNTEIKEGVSGLNNYHAQNFYETVTSSIGINVAGFVNENGLGKLLDTITEDNVEKLTDFKVTTQKRIADIVRNSLVGQESKSPSLEKTLREVFSGVSKNEAKFIARDQTQRAVNSLNRFRQTAAGIKKYKWVTSADNRVRDKKGHNHKIMNGIEVEWKSGKIVKNSLSTQRKIAGKNVKNIAGGHVGQEYQCRCISKPILEV